MLHFIHPVDESTKFLESVYYNVSEAIGSDNVKVFSFEGEHEYLEDIKKLPKNSDIVFLGHGRGDRLYGVLENSNDPYVSVNEMETFNDQNLLAVACKSSELLKNSYRNTSVRASIGFGYLPTSGEEVQAIRNMRTKAITNQDIESFKQVIVGCVGVSLIKVSRENLDFRYLYSHIRLLLNKEMNATILDKKLPGVASLIYQMLYQMTFYESLS